MSDDKNNKIEIISGDGSNLDISPAYDHINNTTPQPSSKKPKNIVIPKDMEDKHKEDNDDNNE